MELEKKNDKEWILVTKNELSTSHLSDWVVLPSCGAFVIFGGTVRNTSKDDEEVFKLNYEAYESYLGQKLDLLSESISQKYELGRIGIHHRLGEVNLGEISVLVAVSSPHREESFLAAKDAIDTLKETIPIWKEECFKDRSDWVIGS